MEPKQPVQPTTPPTPPQPQQQVAQPSIVKPFSKKIPKTTALYGLIALVVVLAGVGTGWLLSGGLGGSSVLGNNSQTAPGAKISATEAGLDDESTFRDSAEGVLEEGGIEGEGTHHLVREGGASQNVYLTSTVIDLESFKGKKVKIWGETISAKKAGWLMDVGKIKVVD